MINKIVNNIKSRNFLILGFLFVFIFPVSSQESVTPLAKEGIHLIPYPQEVSIKGNNFIAVSNLTIVVDKDASKKDHFAAKELANDLKQEWDIKAKVAKNPSGKSIILTRKEADAKLGEEGYSISAGAEQVIVKANSEAGLFYGTQTVLQLFQENDSSVFIKGLEINDWPDIQQRSIHYDTKHHQDTKSYVENFIKDLARYKVNMLVWEWEDKFAYPSHPEIGAPGAFNMEEMQEFTRFAQQYHIQIVPLVQGLGHVSFILKWPQFAHLREVPSSNWEFCPLKEGSYELLFDLWEDAIEATPGSEYIHIGSDETYELGVGPECQKKAEEIGKSGLYHLFVGKSAEHLQNKGRKVMAWERPMGWRSTQSVSNDVYSIADDKEYEVKPQEGLVLTESFSMGDDPDLENVRKSKELGYEVFAYDPNPGIEHIFLPYYFKAGKRALKGSLDDSYEFLTTTTNSGLFDGMIRTSWDDAGLHNQVWMLSFAIAAEYSWSGMNPGLEEFKDSFFKNYYGKEVRDMQELFRLMNEAAYYEMSTLERNVWHHGDVGKTHLPDLPRGDAFEYDPFWNKRYADMVKESALMINKMDRALQICEENMNRDLRNTYDFEVFASLANLIKHTGQVYLDLSELENIITRGHRQHFVDHKVSYEQLEKAEELIRENLARRENVFNSLVDTWEKTRLPKGMSTPNKEYFYEQDRARHYAHRTPDMTYLIYDEQLLDLEGYLEALQEYQEYYKNMYLQ